jgi:GNS1/SUR4 family
MDIPFISGFEWGQSLPLASREAVGSAVVVYLVLVLSLHSLIKKPVAIPTIIAVVHNLILCVGSLIMFVGAAYESYQVCRWLQCTENLFGYLTGLGDTSFYCSAIIYTFPLRYDWTQETLRTGNGVWMLCLPKGTKMQVMRVG